MEAVNGVETGATLFRRRALFDKLKVKLLQIRAVGFVLGWRLALKELDHPTELFKCPFDTDTALLVERDTMGRHQAFTLPTCQGGTPLRYELTCLKVSVEQVPGCDSARA